MRRLFKWGTIAVISLIVLIIIVSVASGGNHNGNSNAAPAASPMVTGPSAHSSPSAIASASAKPAQPATPQTLYTLSGNGIKNSPTFKVSGPVDVNYKYSNCDSGGSGNFIADLISGNPSAGTYDDESIANTIGSEGSDTTTVYPNNPGSPYYISVNTECDFTVTVRTAS